MDGRNDFRQGADRIAVHPAVGSGTEAPDPPVHLAIPRPATRPDSARILAGILLSVAAATCFALLDGVVKALTPHHHPLMSAWARYAGHLMLMVVFLGPRYGLGLVRTGRPWFQVARGAVILGATASFFTSMLYLPLATAAAISFAAPLVITALSVPLLAEHVGPRRWAAVVVGFLGVVIVMRPNAGLTHWATLLPLAAAFCNGAFYIMTRMARRTESPITSLIYPTLVGTVALGVVLPFVWSAPTATSAPLLLATSVLGGLGHLCLILSLNRIEASVAAPYSYIYVVLMVLIGYLLFDEIPDLWTILGGSIICASGLYIMVRETRQRRAAGP